METKPDKFSDAQAPEQSGVSKRDTVCKSDKLTV
jgi:hypothetical protein